VRGNARPCEGCLPPRPSIARFSVSHDITGASSWTTAFFLMAFGQVIARVGMLQLRRIRSAGTVPAHEPATMAL
jgi:hypothetical protein